MYPVNIVVKLSTAATLGQNILSKCRDVHIERKFVNRISVYGSVYIQLRGKAMAVIEVANIVSWLP